MPTTIDPVRITLPFGDTEKRILSSEAQEFLVKLHRNFNKRRLQLLRARNERQEMIDKGAALNFLAETTAVRLDPTWKVASIPKDLLCRLVEITGPTDSKMMINALNSGADVYMADFEDANAPTWENMIGGQGHLIDAIDGTLTYTTPEGKAYRINDQKATIIVRPRGWHLEEKHFLIEDEPISASLFDFGLAFFHNAKNLIARGSGPYFYLPKMESYQEARLWNDIFLMAQEKLDIPRGTIRATVLIETIFATFEMHEILFELREHSAGLNAGRWDYLFSTIKTFAQDSEFIFPDRSEITMKVPFMKAYTRLLIDTCHSRGAQAIGGMAAFIPNKKNPEINIKALAKVREDKIREKSEGFDGTWVAHPDLVPTAKEVFIRQKSKNNPEQRDTTPSSETLQNFTVEGHISLEGFRQNIVVAIEYIAGWLGGIGAVAIANLMEDAATAEISRAQLWQWIHHEASLDDGTPISEALYHQVADEEQSKLAETHPYLEKNLGKARSILDTLVTITPIPPFFTTIAYKLFS